MTEKKSKVKALKSKMDKDIERLKRKKSLMKASPAAYKAMIRERGYQKMEENTGKPVQRFRKPGETKELNRLIDFSKEYNRKKVK
jgi:hypothetical protein